MVKRSRGQSAEAPRRRSWRMMVPPDCAFHSQTFSRKASRPMVWALARAWPSEPARASTMPCPANCRSTTDLGGDAGMIGARLPEHVAPAHALVAHQHVLQGEGQRMADMQAARHIGRRHHDGEGGRRGIGVAGEIAALLPARVVPSLDLGRVECLLEHEACLRGGLHAGKRAGTSTALRTPTSG